MYRRGCIVGLLVTIPLIVKKRRDHFVLNSYCIFKGLMVNHVYLKSSYL